MESIVRQSPSFDTTNAESVTFRVTFSEGVTGVTGSSFVIAPGSVSAGATIQLVTQVDAAGTQYDVVVGGLKGGNGKLNIDLVPGTEGGITSKADAGKFLSNANPDDPSKDHSYIIDTSISQPSVDAIAGGVKYSQGLATKDASHFVFSGKADAGDTVRVFIGTGKNAVELGSVIADSSGNWSIEYNAPSALNDGNHTLVVRSSDRAGNTATATTNLRVDTTPPDVPSGTVSDVVVELKYQDELLDEGIRVGANGFTVKDGAGTDYTVKEIIVKGDTVLLILNTPLAKDVSVTVSYDGQHGVQDIVGNVGLAFTDKALVNNTRPTATEGGANANTAPVVMLPKMESDLNTGGDRHQVYGKGDGSKSPFSDDVILSENDAGDYIEGLTIEVVKKNGGAYVTGDTLTINQDFLPEGIRVESNANGKLVLTGHATAADYNEALKHIRFSATSGFTINDTRLVKVAATDGQDVGTGEREIRMQQVPFLKGQSEIAYLLGSDGKLYEVNLVMNTTKLIGTVSIPGGTNLNALSFSKEDGHLYAVDNNTKNVYILSNKDGANYTVEKLSNTLASGGQKPTTNMISADMGPDGIIYMNTNANGGEKSKIFRFDANAESPTYGQWLEPVQLKDANGNNFDTAWVDMVYDPRSEKFYAVGSGTGTTLYSIAINGSEGLVVQEAASIRDQNNSNPGTSFPMQYFDAENSHFYFSAGGNNAKIYRIDISDRDGDGKIKPKATSLSTGTNLPSSGDAGREVTIKLDYGDAKEINGKSYKTTYEQDGARHSLVRPNVYLGKAPNAETDARTGASGDGDTDDGIAFVPKLPSDKTEYSVQVSVSTGGKAAKLVAWIDFNRDGKFSFDESVTIDVPAGHKDGDKITVTWTGLGAGAKVLTEGETWARFRITSETTTLDNDHWNLSGNDLTAAKLNDANGHDKRSYGARMDGEVEDYKITIIPPDNTPPDVTDVDIMKGGNGPRYVPVGEVRVKFSESVHDVDVGDFVLYRDGVVVPLTAETVGVRQDPDDPAVWYIDLSQVTSPTGEYELVVMDGPNHPSQGAATIVDDSGNGLRNGGSVAFIIDNTAPLIDLDSGDSTTRDYQTTFQAGQSGGASLDNSLSGREGTVEENTNRVTSLDIAVGGLRDGEHEKLVFGDVTLRADGADTDANGTAAQVGGVNVLITYDAAKGQFTLTPTGGTGEMTAAEAQAIVRAIEYKNTSPDGGSGFTATDGERTFAFTATDKAGSTASPAIATVEVVDGIGTKPPSVPTVERQTTSNTTPTIKGGADVPTGGKLEVEVNGKTYTWDENSPPDHPLQYNDQDKTWALTIPDDDALDHGTYSVDTTTVSADGNQRIQDRTFDELIIDRIPPDAPAVPNQQTHDTTPPITGTAEVRDGEKLTVSVVIGGKTYTYTEGTTEGDKYLKRDNNIWSLQVPSDAPMSVGEYEVTATVKDAAGNVSDEAKGKVTIKPVAVTSPTVNEASGHAVFEVTVLPGTSVQLRLEEIANSATGSGTDFGTATGTGLEYFDGTDWVAYTVGAKVAADSNGKLLVRTPITNDDVADDGEQFKLIATPVYGSNETITDNKGEGTATIKDDGTGDIFDPSTGDKTPTDPNAPGYVPRDNDLTVNETSDYAVFDVQATPGAKITLELRDGTATGGGTGFDYGSSGSAPNLAYSTDDGQTWHSYTSGSGDQVTVPTDGRILVRTPIIDDDVPDDGETFDLIVTQGSGEPVIGTATIKDDGTGDMWMIDPYDPDRGLIKNPNEGDPAYKPKDNDLTVSSPTVNEASDYAVFDVQATPNTEITLTLTPGSADGGGTDFGTDGSAPNLEYSTDGGQTWTEYNTGDKVTVPADGKVLVRTPVVNDGIPDDGEQFTLTVRQGSGVPVTGTATIKDDGTGTIWVPTDPTDPAGPLTPVTPGGTVPPGVTPPVFDDDRELIVSGGTVNEGSDYGSFVVEGAEGQKVQLELVDGTATVGSETNDKSGATDYTGDLEYFDGTQWKSYIPGEYVEIPEGGQLWVRVPVVNDDLPEGEHAFKLKATNTGGGSGEGTVTIDDEGQGDLLDGHPAGLERLVTKGHDATDDPARTGPAAIACRAAGRPAATAAPGLAPAFQRCVCRWLPGLGDSGPGDQPLLPHRLAGVRMPAALGLAPGTHRRRYFHAYDAGGRCRGSAGIRTVSRPAQFAAGFTPEGAATAEKKRADPLEKRPVVAAYLSVHPHPPGAPPAFAADAAAVGAAAVQLGGAVAVAGGDGAGPGAGGPPVGDVHPQLHGHALALRAGRVRPGLDRLQDPA